MTGEKRDTLCGALAESIREASRAGRLADADWLRSRLEARSLLAPGDEDAPDMNALLAETLAAHRDLAALAGISGRTLYHAPELLSRTYAFILDRRASPVLLMAGEVRRNSEEYPRPLPLEIFEAAPFDLTPEQIEAGLKTMAATPEFQDITYTTTSTGAVYLFSTLYLDRAYAAFLAERADVDLAQNP